MVGRRAATRLTRAGQQPVGAGLYQPPATRRQASGINRSADPALSSRLPVSRPGDRQELQADQLADGALRATGGADPATHRPARPPGNSAAARRPADPGRPLDAPVRHRFEQGFGVDLGAVRIHTTGQAAGAARALAATAFTVGSDIAFSAGRYAPGSQAGDRLLAHELAHVVQGKTGIARQPAEDSAVQTAATVIAGKVRDGDVAGVVTELEHNLGPGLATLRGTVSQQIGQPLERWLLGRAHRAETAHTVARAAALLTAVVPALAPLAVAGALTDRPADPQAAERGIRLLWPTLTLIARLQLYDEGWRELEQAQLDVIRAASPAERRAAATDPAIEAIYRLMDPSEEFQARKLIDPSPTALYTAVGRLLARAPGFLSNDDDAVFSAVLELAPSQRRTFFNDHLMQLYRLLSVARFRLMSTMCSGTEAQALLARLRQATEGRRDDMTAVAAVVDRLVALLRERAELRAALPSLLPAQQVQARARLDELSDLDDLLRYTRGAGGALNQGSFLGMLAAARDDPTAFAGDAARLAAFAAPAQARQAAFESAKQQILMSGGNVAAIQAAVAGLHAPPAAGPAGAAPTSTGAPTPTGADSTGTGPARTVPVPDPAAQQAADEAFRRELLRDPDVAAVINGLTGFNRMLVQDRVTSTPFDAALVELNRALQGAEWGTFFRQTLLIARTADWGQRFRATAGDWLGVYAQVHGDARVIMERILNTRQLPLPELLRFFGGAGRLVRGGADAIVAAVDDIGESERAQLRMGYALVNHPRTGPPTATENAAIDCYRQFASQLSASFGTGDSYQRVLWAVLGSVPTEQDWSTEEGRFRAAQLMYDQQQARLALDRGLSQHFTEADETMAAAAREFGARFEQVRPSGRLTAVDFALLASLHDRFLGRASEFAEASNAISDMAGMVAATVAGIVVVAATGGAATPAVIAMAAAAGAGSRVVSKEMFGGAYADVNGRDVLLGAVDGALAVVSAALAARGAQLLGLGGEALAHSAARLAGEVAQEASEVAGRSGVALSRRVAASAVQSALDGAFSGAVSETFGTMTNPGTWRRGIWRGLVQVGEAALQAGLTGLISGGLIGAALPVIGAGWSRVSDALATRAIEDTLARAGMSQTLAAARTAARAGDVATVDRLLRQLEDRLTEEQVRVLRRQVYGELQAVVGSPLGRAQPSEAQARLLAETGAVDDGARLSRAQLDAELDVVRRSEPRPSTEAGYLDEVDLGNGHTWRRRDDGRWCRFSTRSLCGTTITGAHAVSAEVQARIASLRGQLEMLRADVITTRELIEEYPQVVARLRANTVPGQRTINFAALTEREQEVLAQVFHELDEAGMARLTWPQIEARSR
ncbi:MAG TPA: DUF4157 domain-containing protein, partial [Jatrophihabitans sp.]|nr:DUF4157 domain-containing protein [Jatrophihabitans sp.]